jgi:DNA helicase II / ATP-dependent DNA helicase PcrA
MALSTEQQTFVDHGLQGHARLLAGPGTGKSFTSVAYLEALADMSPKPRCHMITFTRAATQELQGKFAANPRPLTERPPSTAHSFALWLLMRGSDEKLRMADDWENRHVIEEAVGHRMKVNGFDGGITNVQKLVKEMAAGWQGLDEERLLLSEFDSQLADGFRAAWFEAQRTLGFLHVSEIPYKAVQKLEDTGVEGLGIDVLVVDEYQDLNSAEVKLIRLISQYAQIVAIGDDDQSIYSWREAAPQALLAFPFDYQSEKFELTICHRSAKPILDPAMAVIGAMPGRPAKTALVPSDPSRPGTFVQLRFDRSSAEFTGTVELVRQRIASGVAKSDIAILVRSSANKWRAELLPLFTAAGIELTNVDWVNDALEEDEVRRLIAIGRLIAEPLDSLSWMSLLLQTAGVGKGTVMKLYDAACDDLKTFAQFIVAQRTTGFSLLSGAAKIRIAAAVETVHSTLAELNGEYVGAKLDDRGWGGWLLDRGNRSNLSDDALRIFDQVGKSVATSGEEEGIASFLNQLQPLAKDITLNDTSAVRLMSMGQSKGLTVNTAILLGVDNDTVPNPRGKEEEERRILYVAMTRATDFCAITFSEKRSGTTARIGSAGTGSRRRSRFLQDNPAIGSPVEWGHTT